MSNFLVQYELYPLEFLPRNGVLDGRMPSS